MARRTTIINTKLEIIRVALNLFLTEGYTNTSVSKIANELGISLGNLTFHFHTKEHLLAELIEYLCEYHLIVMEQEVEGGKTTLLAYLLELTSMMAVCEESEIAKDLYLSAYTHSLSLELIRKSDAEKAKMVFSQYRPEWNDEDFVTAENIVSGMEYASFCKENADTVPFDKRVKSMLEAVMKIYNVPLEIQEVEIKKIQEIDYRRIGRRFIDGFMKYVETESKRALDRVTEKEKEKNMGDRVVC